MGAAAELVRVRVRVKVGLGLGLGLGPATRFKRPRRGRGRRPARRAPGGAQVMVEALDRNFKNVCELDIIFNVEQVHSKKC